MKLGRRQFLQLGIIQGLVVGAQKANAGDTPPVQFIQRRKGPSIIQGATDDSQTQFSIVYQRSSPLKVRARTLDGEIVNPVFEGTHEMGDHPDRVSKFYFSGLNPNLSYILDVFHADSLEKIDQRSFKLLNPNQENLKFSLCSCMNDEGHDPTIWQNMVKQKPDILFFIGDSVYADTGAPSGGANPTYLWKRFCEARRTLEIYYSPTLIPIFATWDDHDFGLNDSHSQNYKYVSESQKNFLTFFAQDPQYCRFLTAGPGVSSVLRWQKQVFLLMDDRSFRLPAKSKDRYAQWGQGQENWMLQQIGSNADVSWIMNGSQIFPAMPFKESVSKNHPQQLWGVVEILKELPSKIVFVSGDVHYTEVSELEKTVLGYRTYELTSSSIHSRNFPGVPDIVPNKRRIAGNGKRNYLMVTLRSDFQDSSFRCDSVVADGGIAFTKKLTVG